MITPERLDLYKKKALAAVAARAKNPADAGVTCVSVSPHDMLDLVHAIEELRQREQEKKKKEEA